MNDFNDKQIYPPHVKIVKRKENLWRNRRTIYTIIHTESLSKRSIILLYCSHSFYEQKLTWPAHRHFQVEQSEQLLLNTRVIHK